MNCLVSALDFYFPENKEIRTIEVASMDLEIPSCVEVIKDNFMANNKFLRRLYISKGIKSIGKNAFSNCINLEEIILPEEDFYIGQGAFSGCYNLKSFKMI